MAVKVQNENSLFETWIKLKYIYIFGLTIYEGITKSRSHYQFQDIMMYIWSNIYNVLFSDFCCVHYTFTVLVILVLKHITFSCDASHTQCFSTQYGPNRTLMVHCFRFPLCTLYFYHLHCFISTQWIHVIFKDRCQMVRAGLSNKLSVFWIEP